MNTCGTRLSSPNQHKIMAFSRQTAIRWKDQKATAPEMEAATSLGGVLKTTKICGNPSHQNVLEATQKDEGSNDVDESKCRRRRMLPQIPKDRKRKAVLVN